MPSVQQVTSRVRRDDAASSHAAILSRPAIIGIALGGSFVLFLALSHLFIVLGRRRDRQRLAALQDHAHAVRSPVAHLGHQPDPHHRAWLSSPFVDPYDSDIPVGGAGGKNRLRKKTVLLSEYVAAVGSDRDMTDRSTNWTSHQGIALPVLPPVFSRQQSYDLNPFLSSGPELFNDGCSSTRGRDDDFERVENQRMEKQRGREMYQMRRRSSWIDEDALHGPKVSPQKKQKKIKEENGNRMSKGGKGKMSWLLAGSLTRRLSLKRPLSDSTVFGSPTLPHMEQPRVAVGLGAAAEDRGRSRQRRPASISHADAGATTPPGLNSQDSPLKPGQHNTVRIAIPSAISAPILPVPKPPAAMINNPRHRNSVGLDAAQLLASNAKVSNGQQQRPSLPKHSATDSELSEILRMTTERLQDGKRSSRRQTMLIRSKTGDLESVYHEHSNMNLLTVDSRTSSPTKSQKSAPAVMCAELEANEVSPTKPQNNPPELQQVATPSRRSQQHHLHQQHSRQLSQMSLASEADSMITMRAMSQPDEHTTALSSPNRNVKIAAEPLPRREDTPLRQQQQQPTRPYSAASSNSSALSTLYSEDEGATTAGPGLQYNAKRGTLGQVTFLPPPRPLIIAKSDDTDKRRSTVTGSGGLVKAWLPRETSLHFTIYAMDEEPDGPFTTTKTTPDPVRLSQVFTPLPPSSSFNNELDDDDSSHDDEEDAASSFKGWPSEMLTQHPTVRVTRPSSNKEKSTPTPSPKNNRIRPPTIVLPPPTIEQQQQQGALRPMTSSPTLGAGLPHGRPSPVLSEGGLSSVYESYASSEGGGASLNYSTATLSTVPTNESWRSQGGEGILSGQPILGRVEDTLSTSRLAPEAKPTRPHAESLISVDSVYSQDQDQQERNSGSRQQGLGLGLRLGLRGDLPEKQPGTRLQRNQNNRDQGNDDEDDTVPALATTGAPTVNPQRTSYVLAHTVAELRRMNSTVSAASGASSVATTTSTFTEGVGTGSPTLPAMRGGGFSPGKRTSGTRNYLAVGSPPKRRSVQQQQQRPMSQFGNITATREAATAAEAPRGSGLARSGARSRRGTMSSGGGNTAGRLLLELSETGGVLREGSGGNLGGREGGKIMDKERLHVISAGVAAGTSSESLGLYDDKGFLRSSPMGRGWERIWD